MKFLGVLWALRLRGTVQKLALSLLPMLPSTFPIVSASPLRLFEAPSPSPPIPLFTLRRSPHDDRRKTRGRVDRYSFLVRLFHSLLHAGLSRRTGIGSAALEGLIQIPCNCTQSRLRLALLHASVASFPIRDHQRQSAVKLCFSAASVPPCFKGFG
jgi:hypothetical protein